MTFLDPVAWILPQDAGDQLRPPVRRFERELRVGPYSRMLTTEFVQAGFDLLPGATK